MIPDGTSDSIGAIETTIPDDGRIKKLENLIKKRLPN
jgi:hypothetical protein